VAKSQKYSLLVLVARIAEEIKITIPWLIPMDLRIARKADEGMAFVIQNPQDFARST
jgi:hypothetical protein